MFHVKRISLLFFLFPLVSRSQHVGATTLEIKNLPVLPCVDKYISEFVNRNANKLTPTETEWFYWTNYSRVFPIKFWDSVIKPLIDTYPSLRNSYTVSLKKDLYKTVSLPMVKSNLSLKIIANHLAFQLAEKRSSPSHTSPSGETFSERMLSMNIKLCAGENISFGPPNALLMLSLLFIDEGVPDLGHRKALLNPSFVEMGIGVGVYSENKFLVVQDFACSQQ